MNGNDSESLVVSVARLCVLLYVAVVVVLVTISLMLFVSVFICFRLILARVKHPLAFFLCFQTFANFMRSKTTYIVRQSPSMYF